MSDWACVHCGAINEQPKMALDTEADPEADTEADPGAWPDWYGDLLEIEGFDRQPEEVDEWLAQQRISESQANKAASSLLAKWDKLNYPQAWPACRNWAQSERDRPLSRPGGTGGSGAAVSQGGYSWAWDGRR